MKRDEEEERNSQRKEERGNRRELGKREVGRVWKRTQKGRGCMRETREER